MGHFMRQTRFFTSLGAAVLVALAVPAAAQSSDPNQILADSLSTLSREPKNLSALMSAGRASLQLGDMQAAAGFFGRADEAYPQSPYPKIGMGASLTMGGDPQGALVQFQRAQSLGAPLSTFAIDRGLAYDLLGQQAQAQADYRTGMIGEQADEARRRLALSQAISRDFKGAGATLEPLLRRRDQAAIRTNAFILALAGDREGAKRTIDQAMPGNSAQFEPFFRMLPVLKPEEKAAAVHLGEFPTDAAQRFAQAERVRFDQQSIPGTSRYPGEARIPRQQVVAGNEDAGRRDQEGAAAQVAPGAATGGARSDRPQCLHGRSAPIDGPGPLRVAGDQAQGTAKS
jgi:Flp pilus assembly protein TadD